MTTPKKDKTLPPAMSTITEVLNKLKEKDLYNEFTFCEKEGMKGFDKKYKPQDLTIIKTYRFEGMSNPSDNNILYLLEDKQGNVGFLLDAYGFESNYGLDYIEFIKAIPVQERLE